MSFLSKKRSSPFLGSSSFEVEKPVPQKKRSTDRLTTEGLGSWGERWAEVAKGGASKYLLLAF